MNPLRNTQKRSQITSGRRLSKTEIHAPAFPAGSVIIMKYRIGRLTRFSHLIGLLRMYSPL